jgi:SAM-dependent methyltransferase
MSATCRSCGAELRHSFCDLGLSPLSNAYLSAEHPDDEERLYPLHARVCGRCMLVQLEQFETPAQIFSDYAYFSSYSDTWLRHAERYVEMACTRFGIGKSSRVVEIASNDGYLLQYFVRRGVPVLGIEPAANVARAAEARGVQTLVEFFGEACARRLAGAGRPADLLIANNVLAHVPALNDFVAGLRLALAPRGAITCEFPHLLRLIQGGQFDTIYHEHFSYFSLLAAQRVFASHGLRVFDVEELPTHGGSLRVYVGHAGGRTQSVSPAVDKVLAAERVAGLDRIESYAAFQGRAETAKRAFVQFLDQAGSAGKRVAAYGAAAKGNTLLNYCGVRGNEIDYVADRSPHKQGRLLPGTRIPIVHPDRIGETRPDYLIILPWNIRQEIVQQNAAIRAWGGRFVIAVPLVEVF